MGYPLEHYPTRWIDVWTLDDGRRVTVRPVLPQDAALEQALVRGLSAEARYQRFFAPIRELPADWLARLTQIDYRQQQAFIAETFVAGQPQAVAEARYVVDDDGQGGDFALMVADDWRQHGLGRRLLQLLIDSAGTAGLPALHGDVLATNRGMLSLAQRLGFRVTRHPDGGAQVLRVQRRLVEADASAAWAIAPGPSARPAVAAT